MPDDDTADWYLYDKLGGSNVEASAESEVLEKIPDEDVQRALEDLPDGFRMAVLLADVEGFSYKEIAEIIDVPIGTVMSRLHRGRKACRRRCGRPYGSEVLSPTDCEHVLKQIELYLDGELVGSLRVEIERHQVAATLQRARRLPAKLKEVLRSKCGCQVPELVRPRRARTGPNVLARRQPDPPGAHRGTEPLPRERRIGNVTKGSRPGHLPAPSRALERGRVCAHEDAGRRFSVYNEGAFCWQHADVVFPNYRGKRLRSDRARRAVAEPPAHPPSRGIGERSGSRAVLLHPSPHVLATLGCIAGTGARDRSTAGDEGRGGGG